MKCLYLIILIVVLIKVDNVSCHGPGPCYCPLGHNGGYILGFTNAILFFIIIVLLVIVYKLKKKTYCDSVDDKIEITKTFTSNTYNRQVSSDTSHTFTRENSNEDPRFKLKREESKMSILEYPGTYDTNRKKREGPQPATSTLTLSKFDIKQTERNDVVNVNKEQMEEICKGVLLKMQQKNEFTSLSNLESILHEEKEKENENKLHDSAEKSASTSVLLDVADNSESQLSPITAKKIISNIETTQSPIPIKKLIKLAENNRLDGSTGFKSHLPFRLPAFNTDKNIVIPKQEDITDKTSPVNQTVSDNYLKNDESKEVKVDVDSLTKKSQLTCEDDDDAHLIDIYDNPPNNRPVIDTTTDDDDIYGDFPSNRPVSNRNVSDDMHTSDIYDEVLKDTASHVKNLSSIHKTKSGEFVRKNSTYDSPQPNEDDTEFDSKYINARTYQA